MLARVAALLSFGSALLALSLPLTTAACGIFVPSDTIDRALDPANKPIDACVKTCKARASRQCSDAECGRGCEFILDRLLEKEGDNVIACVARRPRRCTDVVWADCAAHVGPHADGGPPAPASLEEEE